MICLFALKIFYNVFFVLDVLRFHDDMSQGETFASLDYILESHVHLDQRNSVYLLCKCFLSFLSATGLLDLIDCSSIYPFSSILYRNIKK